MPDVTRWTEEVGATAGKTFPSKGYPWSAFVRYDRDGWLRSLLYRDESDGLPGPSLLMVLPGSFRILWPVNPGPRTFTVWCKHSGALPRPRVRVAAAPDLGVAETTVEALNTLDWHSLMVSVTPIKEGVLEVFLEHRSSDANSWTRWDRAEAI